MTGLARANAFGKLANYKENSKLCDSAGEIAPTHRDTDTPDRDNRLAGSAQVHLNGSGSSGWKVKKGKGKRRKSIRSE